ncbi:MAG: serine hydrolase [Cyclobacteriaceae bacterium]
MKTFLSIIIAFLYIGTAEAQYFPGKIWEEKDPKLLKVDVPDLNKAVEFAMANEYSGAVDMRQAILKGFEREPYHEIVGPTKRRGGPAGLVIKGGYIIAKWGDIDRVDMTFSVTKSYLSTTAGLALDAGLIKDVNDKVANHVWDGTFEGNHNAKITWDHLLTQSSDWYGDLFGMQDWGDRPPQEGDIHDWKKRELLEPGSSYEYNDVRVNVLAYSLLHVWRKPLPQVLKEKIMDPIGASSTWRWYGYENSWVTIDGLKMQSVSGGGHSGGGVFISAADHARFGLLFLRNGNWNGQQLISEDWVKMVQKSSKANASYGYMWWLNRGDRKWDNDLSEDIYYAAGFGGNYIVVDKANDLVVVTRWLEPSKLGEMMGLVMAALK